MANDGEIDGDFARTLDATARYPNLEAVPTPVGKLFVVIYGSSPDIANKTRADIARMRVGTMRGILLIAKHSHGMAVSESSSVETAFEMLLNQHVDVVMVDYVNAASQLQKFPLPGIYRWPHVWAEEPLYMVLNKKHAALVPKIDAALLQMTREGLLDRYREESYLKYRIAPLSNDARPR